MIQVKRDIITDVTTRSTGKAVVAKQNDTGSRILNVHINESGKSVNISETSKVLLNVRRPDGSASEFAGSVNADGTVSVELNSWILGQAGLVSCDISIVNESSKLTTMTFYVEVEPAVCTDEDIEESDEYNVFVDIFNKLNESAAIAEKAAEDAENAANSARRASEDADYLKTTCESAAKEAKEAAAEASAFETNLEVERSRINTLVAMKGDSNTATYAIEDDYFTANFRTNGTAARIYLKHKNSLAAGEEYISAEYTVPVTFAPFGDVELQTRYSALRVVFALVGTGDEYYRMQVKITNTANEPVYCNGAIADAYYPTAGIFIDELSDLRVDYKGNTYETAGEAIREQIKDVGKTVLVSASTGVSDYTSNELFIHYQKGHAIYLYVAPFDFYPPVFVNRDVVVFGGHNQRLNQYITYSVDGSKNIVQRVHPIKASGDGIAFNDVEHNKAEELAAAFGEETKAIGKAAFATGAKKTRSGGKDTVAGDMYYTEAIGGGSMAAGMGAVAFSRASKSLGYRTQTGYPPSADWITKRTGVVVKKDAQGNDTFPADNVGQGAVAMGSDTVALENHTFAGGYKSKAIATASFAYGSENVTKGNCSVAMGSHNEANEECSVAFGASTKALGKWSFAAGEYAEARSNCSVAMGDGTVTAKQYDENGNNRENNPGYAQMVVGRYNAYENGECDKALFVVGNGDKDQTTGKITRRNAFIVDKDGNASVTGKLSFGSVDDSSASAVREIVTTNTLPASGKFDGQMCMLNTSKDEGATITPKTAIYIWSSHIHKWIKIAEETGLSIGIE